MLGLILLSILLLIIGFATFIPITRTEKLIDFSIINLEGPDANLPADLPVYLTQDLQILKLSTPQWLWRGDPETIVLSIQPKANSPTLQNSTEGNSARYPVYLEVRMELGAVQMLTGDTIIEALNVNQSAQFLWQVKAEKSGRARGNLWIVANITDSQSGNTWKITRFALPLQMEVKDIFGFSLSSVRILALIGLFLVFSAGLVLIISRMRNVKKW
jgi:hypothetical protein